MHDSCLNNYLDVQREARSEILAIYEVLEMVTQSDGVVALPWK